MLEYWIRMATVFHCPFVYYVADNLYADALQFMRRTIAASIMSVFEVFGDPTTIVQLALSLNKFPGQV
jgi:TPP-dependent pyruvate/acetoin dehydrogenase alpha subunit